MLGAQEVRRRRCIHWSYHGSAE
jgi:hypothetical protein